MFQLPPHTRFFLLQGFGWFWYFVIIFVSITIPSGRDLVVGTIHALMESGFAFLMTTLMWLGFRMMANWYISVQLIIASTVGIIVAGLWTLFKWISFNLIFYNTWSIPEFRDFTNWYTFSFAAMLTWVSVYYFSRYYAISQLQQEKTLKLLAASKEAQLKMLRYQLNPHFLLNAMNSISTLILKKDNTGAYNMVEKLGHFLSAVLEGDPADMISLEEELDTLQQFVDIQQIRFGKRLQYRVDIAPECAKVPVPSLLLQPLVENAIKYAVASQVGGGEITVKARMKEKQIVIDVADNGPGLSEESLARLNGLTESDTEQDVPSAREGRNSKIESDNDQQRVGIGIANTQERLEALYGESAQLSFHTGKELGLTVRMEFPAQ